VREVQTLSWCDECYRDDPDSRTPVVASFVVGIVEGESVRPALRVLLCCEAHAKPVRDLLAILADAEPFAADEHPRKGRPPKQLALDVDVPKPPQMCPLCDYTRTTRGAVVTHVWNVHANAERPPQPDACPDCGWSGGNIGVHRSQAHGFNALDEALSHVPKPRRKR
jgi:hypothetical protein